MSKKIYFLIVVIVLLSTLTVKATQTISFLREKVKHTTDQQKVLWLDSLSWAYMYENPDSCIFFSRKGRQLASQYGLQLDMANTYNSEGVAHIVTGEYNEAIVNIRHAIALGEKLLTKNPDNKKVMRRLLSYHTNIGNCHYYFGDYPVVITNYQKAIDYAKKVNYSGIGTIYSNLGAVYNEVNKNDLAIKYQNLAFKEAKFNNDYGSMGQAMNNIGTIYSDKLMNDSALLYFQRGLKYYLRASNTYESVTSYLNIGNVFTQTLNFDSAYYYLQKSYTLSNKIEYSDGIINYYLQIGELYYQQKDYKKAIENFQNCYRLSQKSKNSRSLYLVTDKLSNAYYQKGDYKMAFDYYDFSRTVQDSLFNEDADWRIANLEVKYQVKEKELKINVLEVQNKKDKQIKFSLLALLIVFLLAVGIVSYIYLKKRKTEKEKDAIEKRLIISELEQSRLSQEEKDKEIEYKTNQLTSHALHMMQKNNMMTELLEPISMAMKDANDDMYHQLMLLKRKIKDSIHVDDDWSVFKMYFEQVNMGFFDKLKEINPDLSTNDLRIAALSLLNLNIKETAALLNLSPNSIKSARYKLRKKLYLKTEDSLYNFLKNIV